MIVSDRHWIRLNVVVALVAVATVAQVMLPSGSRAESVPGPIFATAHAHAGEIPATTHRLTETHREIYRKFAIIQACLLIGDHLVKVRRWNDALSHFAHSADKLNSLPHLPATALDPSDLAERLTAVINTVKGQNPLAYNQMAPSAQKELVRTLDSYKGSLPTPTTRLAVIVANELLDRAARAYTSSIEADAFVNPRSYQHSRGLVWSAELLYVDYSVPLETADLRSLGDIRMLINEIKAGLPSAIPPDAPKLDTEKFRAHVSRIATISEAYQ